ncbi:MAG: N-acetyltransferase [Bacteroidetes bacterium]|nr:MAG: N-acetyltransferase [Bacteroidota bacterium]
MAKIITETPRLILREFAPEDALLLYQLNADPDVLRYTGDVPFASVDAARRFIGEYDAYLKDGFGRWTVLLKQGQNPVGWCGLKRHANGLVDLGFRFLQAYWNKGFATEAAEACLAYGFSVLGIREIVGRAGIQNTASVRVLEKIGMEFAGTDNLEGVGPAVLYCKKNDAL